MELTLEFYAVAALAVLMTGVSKSGFAGGLGVLAVPLMALHVSPHHALAVLMPILVAIDVANVWRYRNSWSRRAVLALLPGAMLGVVLGWTAFRWLDEDFLKVGIGLLALGFAAQFVWNRSSVNERTPRLGTALAVGSLSGLTSYVAHAGGPPVKGYLLSQGFEKSAFVGTNSVFFFAVNQLKLMSYFSLGLFSLETAAVSMSLVPFLILGVVLGFRLHRAIDQRTFTNIAYVFLCFAGLKLLWDGALNMI